MYTIWVMRISAVIAAKNESMTIRRVVEVTNQYVDECVVVTPVDTTVSATNPSYTFSALVAEWQPLSGAVGELATASVTWPISGAITKAVA